MLIGIFLFLLSHTLSHRLVTGLNMTLSAQFDLPVPMNFCTCGCNTPSKASEVCSSTVQQLKHNVFCKFHQKKKISFSIHRIRLFSHVTYLLRREDGTSCCLLVSGGMVRNLLSRQTFAAGLNPMCEYVRLLAGGTVGLSSHITFASTEPGTSP